jgi:hypothetical protein
LSHATRGAFSLRGIHAGATYRHQSKLDLAFFAFGAGRPSSAQFDSGLSFSAGWLCFAASFREGSGCGRFGTFTVESGGYNAEFPDASLWATDFFSTTAFFSATDFFLAPTFFFWEGLLESERDEGMVFSCTA